MKNFLLAVTLLAASLLLPALANASGRTDELVWECNGISELKEFGKLNCARYLDGAMDTHAVMVSAGRAPLFCSPKQGISLDQAMKIFLKWAEKNPEQLHQTARISVILAFVEAFPCE